MTDRYGKGNVEKIGGLWVLHLRGTSFERGLQHGTLMRYRIRDLISFYRGLPENLAARFVAPNSYRMRALRRLKRSMISKLEGHRDSDALEETRGLAVGLGMTPEDLDEALVLADVMQVAGAYAERRRRAGPPVIPGMGCTSAVRETPASGLLFARNFDFWGAGYWDENPAVIFHHPDKGKAFCSIATAGVPTGGITSINEDGLALAVHQHGSRDSTLKASPIMDIAHSIIRRASSVDEAIAVADEFRSSGGWAIMLAGGSGRKAAVLEMSSERKKARWLENHVLVASNVFRDEELLGRELQSSVGSSLSNYARLRRAADIVSSSRITPSRMAGLLGDHYDVFAGRERSAGFTISRICTLSSVVFDLGTRKFWVSESCAPSASGGYVGFDLDTELAGGSSSVGRLEGGRAPGVKITAAQERYVDVEKEYIDTGDLNRVLMILDECARLDPREPSFPFMEGITRAMVGNYRGALSSVQRSLGLEQVETKEKVARLWKARILDLLDRREQSKKIYSDLLENEESPAILARQAKRGLRRPFDEKSLTGIMLDFADSDTVE